MDGYDDLSSCEINKDGENSWSPMISLPGSLPKWWAVRGITIGSQVLMIGYIRLFHTAFSALFRRLGRRSGWFIQRWDLLS